MSLHLKSQSFTFTFSFLKHFWAIFNIFTLLSWGRNVLRHHCFVSFSTWDICESLAVFWDPQSTRCLYWFDFYWLHLCFVFPGDGVVLVWWNDFNSVFPHRELNNMGIWYRMGKVPRAQDSSPVQNNSTTNNTNNIQTVTNNSTPAPVLPKYVFVMSEEVWTAFVATAAE